MNKPTSDRAKVTLVEVLFFNPLFCRVNGDWTAGIEPSSLPILPEPRGVRVSGSVAIPLNPPTSTRFPYEAFENGVEFVIVQDVLIGPRELGESSREARGIEPGPFMMTSLALATRRIGCRGNSWRRGSRITTWGGVGRTASGLRTLLANRLRYGYPPTAAAASPPHDPCAEAARAGYEERVSL